MAAEAVKEKELGNAAYKNKEFETALNHYNKAIELDPTNITFYSNKAAVLFEQQKYDECIELCKKAVDVGREQRAEYTLIAKALTRIGNAYLKLDQLKDAITWFDKSLSEHRDPELVKKKKQLEKDLAEKERLAYINPEIADKEKTLGNELFKRGNYPSAMKHYNEAIKRDPDNAILYSNRAACYTKLMEFQRALEDCEMCIKKDPTFIKGYIRKGAALIAMKEFGKAQTAFEMALALDSNNAEAKEGLMNAIRNNDESPEKARERALHDPEVQEILRDPGMRLLLEQMSNDPGAVREHLQNPDILKKLMKLREAGIIQMR
ncbi:Stress-induced-phosphoprotein 1 [Toxocara canis]|uniref:Stress-induced-phosphoprotein 1 n=1 Tax=Toxocara canis TaxID=6265 RepID=A0A0B2W396_TOXCA|nr:Stress-induced-phosphoprotein 1 [Toxocara canis]